MTALFFGSKDIFSKPPAGYLAVIVPPALLIMYLVVSFRLETNQQLKLRYFSLVSYGITAVVFIVLFSRGALFNNFALEERHFRSVGTLLFVCALVNSRSAGTPI
jgi:chromate transport protein ChrA